MTEHTNHAVYFVPGLERGLRVLEILGAAGEPLALSDIARSMGLSRSSVFRLVYTLRQMNFIKEAEQRNTYTLGAHVLNLGFAFLNQQPITTIARPHLSALRDRTGVSAHLSILEGRDVLYLGSHQARTGFVSNMVTGTRTQAYASAIGWCLLSGLDDTALAAFCRDLDMPAYTAHTPRDHAALLERVRQVRQDGYVVSRGYREAGGSSVAAPVRDSTRTVVGCVNISGPDSAFDFQRMDTLYIPAVLDTATTVSSELGYVT